MSDNGLMPENLFMVKLIGHINNLKARLRLPLIDPFIQCQTTAMLF